jgi:hypothetical protein
MYNETKRMKMELMLAGFLSPSLELLLEQTILSFSEEIIVSVGRVQLD